MLIKVTDVDGDVCLANTNCIVTVFPETDEKDEKTGNTVIVFNQKVDEKIGPIVLQTQKALKVKDSIESIYHKAIDAELDEYDENKL